MNVFLEAPFTINGIKSQIHCIYMNQKKTVADTPVYHYHDYIELLYGIDCEADVFINGEAIKLCSGDMIIINSNDVHFLRFMKESHYIVVKLSPEILFSAGNSVLELKYVMPFLKENGYKRAFRKKELGMNIENLFLNIMDEWNKQRPAYELAIRSDILKVFTEVFRYWDNQNIISDKININEIINKALTYIADNFDVVTEQSVAEYCGYSKSYFSSIFKNAVGKKFSDYIVSLRLKEAEKRLMTTDDSVTEIASFTGFSSSSHFIDKFKKEKGITPYQFKKSIQELQ